MIGWMEDFSKVTRLMKLVKVKPMHPGPYTSCFGKWWFTILMWSIVAITSGSLCTGLLWWSYTGNDFMEIFTVIWKVVPLIVFFLGVICELINWQNWRMKRDLFLKSLKEDYKEKGMVHYG